MAGRAAAEASVSGKPWSSLCPDMVDSATHWVRGPSFCVLPLPPGTELYAGGSTSAFLTTSSLPTTQGVTPSRTSVMICRIWIGGCRKMPPATWKSHGLPSLLRTSRITSPLPQLPSPNPNQAVFAQGPSLLLCTVGLERKPISYLCRM